ncbi:MAG TPA: glycosyltransferase family 1 protein, partial [bacterium]|nr:glycosyltransferase family 1 protein [bacterium]
NGLLVAPGDQQGLAGALVRLLTEEPLRSRMTVANRRLARERYDITLCAARVRDLYLELLC